MSHKSRSFVLAVLVTGILTSLNSIAQQALAADAAPPELESPFRPVERNTFSTLWEATLMVTNQETGVISPELHRYIELASGLNYQVALGNWLPSREELNPTVDGGFAAEFAPNKLRLKRDLIDPWPIELVTEDGLVIRSAPFAIGYFDPVTGRSELLARARSSVAEQTGKAEVTYPDAFDNLHASVRVRHFRHAAPADVILHEAPPPPARFGLSDAARLEVYSEYPAETVEPQKQVALIKAEQDPALRRQMAEPDFTDELLYFGQHTLIGIGRAFSVTDNAEMDDAVPVGKRWVREPGRAVLVEAIEWQSIKPLLTDLPQAAIRVSDREVQMARAGKDRSSAQMRRVLPKLSYPARNENVQLAMRTPSNKGIVIDPTPLTGTQNSYPFNSGVTYRVTGSFGVGPGAATFQNSCYIKYDNNANIYFTGAISFPATGIPPVFTAWNDDLYGEDLTVGSVGVPTTMASPALWVYYQTTGQTIQNARVRWAKKGTQFDANPGVVVTHTLSNSLIEQSDIAVQRTMPNGTVSINSSRQCGVTTPLSGSGGISGSLTFDCGQINASLQATTKQAEGAIAVNPQNTSQIVIVAMDPDPDANPLTNDPRMIAMTSMDGGINWSRSFLPTGSMPTTAGDSDPALAWDDFGNLFLLYRTATGQLALYVSTSIYFNWTAVPGFSMTGDVPAPALATASHGGTYTVWVSAKTAAGVVVTGTQVLALGNVSSNWRSQTLDNSGSGWFTSLAIGPGGEVAAAFVDKPNPVQPPYTIRIAVDNDGYGTASSFANNTRQTFQLNWGYQELVQASGADEPAPAPTLGWYRKTGGGDKVYVVYPDRSTQNPSDSNTDIYVRSSSDKFVTMSAATKVNNTFAQVNGTASQWLPRLSVDQRSGNVAVYWYDCREDNSVTYGRYAHLYMAVSRDGFQSAAPNFRLTPEASDASCANCYGYRDYIGLIYYNGFIYPAWTGNTASQRIPEIFTAKIPY